MKVLGVSFSKSRADVLYDPGRTSPEGMAKALGRYGYVASPLGDAAETERIVLEVEGIDSFEQIPPAEEALRKISGVRGVRTDILKREMIVTAVLGKVKVESLTAALARRGLRVRSR